MQSEVYSVIVTYNPNINLLNDVINSLKNQLKSIIIVDNASKNIYEIKLLTKESEIEIIEFYENRGIASAQNEGISYASSLGAQYILLMDQDTILPDGTVSDLYEECTTLEKRGIKVGAVGTAYRDTHSGKINPIWRANKYRIKKIYAEAEENKLFEVDFVIASGSLIPISSLKEVGLMDENLFIDMVDIEWGLRAKYYGYHIYQTSNHIMIHTIGIDTISFFGKKIPVHRPIRNYFSIRNSIILSKRKYINSAWRLYFLRRVFLYFIVFSFFSTQKFTRIKFMICGIIDGFFNINIRKYF